ncbi:unnamed protein product [Oikopleura dioica]|uniref:Coiled-coil domain-containing protein 77 n=1 Tax=Oikopleura dioica TaxID=34765 RepID=E4XXY8_OIKDI|nr:unnamed protein product [Oikopleura dioica]
MEIERVAEVSLELDDGLPTVEERLAALRPSRQLLEFYRHKVEDLEIEYDTMSCKLDNFVKHCQQEALLERTIRQREKEINDLQKALSDIQVFLLKERECSLRLHAENDKLKIRELEDRKTMQHLLNIAGPSIAECSYFHKEPPGTVVIKEHKAEMKYPRESGDASLCPTPREDPAPKPSLKGDGVVRAPSKLKPSEIKIAKKNSGPSEERLRDDKQILALQVEALRAQLEEHIKLSNDQTTQLMEDRRIMIEEHETHRAREADRTEQLEARLRKTQELLKDTTKDFLEARKAQRERDRSWLQEKDKLLQQLDKAHDRIYDQDQKSPTFKTSGHDKLLSVPSHMRKNYDVLSKPTIDPAVVKKMKIENEALKERLEQAVHLSDMYREQCIAAEEEVSKVKDQALRDQNMYQSKSSKLIDKLELTTKRFSSLEQRRGLETEGYRNEIKKLKERCDQLEGQLYKISIGGLNDIEVLQNFKESAAKSRAIQNQIKSLKKKLYEVENNFRSSN